MVPLLVLCLLLPLLVASQDPPPLKCIQTIGATSSSADCEKDMNACVAIKDVDNLNATKTTFFYTCGKNDSCSNAFTITIGDEAYLHHTSACCTTADCNKNLKWGVPPVNYTKNGLVCSTGCFGETEKTCKGKEVSCRDAETTCFNATLAKDAKKFIMKGCGTMNLCDFNGKNVTINGANYPVNITCTSAKSSSTSHILGKSSSLLLLPSISSLLFMKFLS